MIPPWLHTLSVIALAVGVLCAGIILLDVVRRPQRMAVMKRRLACQCPVWHRCDAVAVYPVNWWLIKSGLKEKM